MTTMPETLAHAKINLFLRVVGRRANGYHDLEMVNVSIDLADRVFVEPAERLTLEIDPPILPVDERNIAYRAARGRPARIRIEKRIPIGAGLAGGSTDAAAVLRLLGDTSDALSLGADVPYCLYGKPAIVRGIGEIIEPITLNIPRHLVLCNPGFEVSTREIFERWKGPSEARDPRSLFHNDLQAVTANLHPEVDRFIAELKRLGAIEAMMSGSGPTVFGIFHDEESARRAAGSITAPFVTYATII